MCTIYVAVCVHCHHVRAVQVLSVLYSRGVFTSSVTARRLLGGCDKLYMDGGLMVSWIAAFVCLILLLNFLWWNTGIAWTVFNRENLFSTKALPRKCHRKHSVLLCKPETGTPANVYFLNSRSFCCCWSFISTDCMKVKHYHHRWPEAKFRPLCIYVQVA